MGNSKDYSVPAIERAIAILDALTEENLTINMIHQNLEIPKTSTFVIMNTLEKHHLIERKEDGTYKLGHHTFRWGMNFYNNIDLVNISRPFIEELIENTPYTGHLAILAGKHPVYIDKIEGNGFVRFATTVGQQLPLHLSGVGKVLGMKLDDKSISIAIQQYKRSISEDEKQQQLENFKSDLQFIKQNGYAIEDEEMEEGIRCLAVPIYGPTDEIIAAFSITALSKDLPIMNFAHWGNEAKKMAHSISNKLGCLA